VVQLTLTLKTTTAQVVETSVIVNNNSPIQDYVHPDDQTQPNLEQTKLQGFKVSAGRYQVFTFCSVNYVTSTYQCNVFVLQSNYHRLGKSWCLHRSANIPGHMRIHRIAPVNWNKATNYHAQVQTVGDSGSLFNEERRTLY